MSERPRTRAWLQAQAERNQEGRVRRTRSTAKQSSAQLDQFEISQSVRPGVQKAHGKTCLDRIWASAYGVQAVQSPKPNKRRARSNRTKRPKKAKKLKAAPQKTRTVAAVSLPIHYVQGRVRVDQRLRSRGGCDRCDLFHPKGLFRKSLCMPHPYRASFWTLVKLWIQAPRLVRAKRTNLP